MADTQPQSGDATIGSRLRDARRLDPGSAGVERIAQAWSEHASGRLNAVSDQPLRVSAGTVRRRGRPRDWESGADRRLYAPLALGAKRPGGFVTCDEEGLEALYAAFFGARPGNGQREATALDRELAGLAMSMVARSAREAFAAVVALDPALGSTGRLDALEEPGGAGAEPGGAGNEFVAFSLTLGVGEQACPITVALPESVLAPHRRALEAEPPAEAEDDPDQSWHDAIVTNFTESDIELEVVLSRWQAPMKQLAKLEVGQTIAMPLGPGDPVTLECQTHPLLRAQIGRSGDAYAARIVERIHPREDFINGILSD